jgi:hypothetical protein
MRLKFLKRGYATPLCGVAGRGKLVDKTGYWLEDNVDSENNKSDGRMIVMPDLVRHLIGSLGSKPMFRMIKETNKRNGGIMLGLGPFGGNWEWLSGILTGGTSYLCLDFKSFDSTIPDWLITEAFTIVKSHFKSVDGDEAYWNAEYRHLVHTQIVLPDGKIYKKQRGVASGDPWTSVIGSYCTWIVIQHCLNVLGISGDIFVFGDDSIIKIDSHSLDELEISKFDDIVWNSFGMRVNMKKSYKTDVLHVPYQDDIGSDSVSFLGNHFLQDGPRVFPIRPYYDLFELMLNPERGRNEIEWELMRTVAMYINFYYNERARYLIEDYWDSLHEKYAIPTNFSSATLHKTLERYDIPYEDFKKSWLTKLPDVLDVTCLSMGRITHLIELGIVDCVPNTYLTLLSDSNKSL